MADHHLTAETLIADANAIAAMRERLTASVLGSREEHPVTERGLRMVVGYAVDDLGDAENRLRQAASALPRTDLPVPDAIPARA